MRKLTILILACGLAAAGCTDESTTPSAVADASNMKADQVVYGLRQVATKEGVRTAELNADTAYLFEDSRRYELVGVRIRFFNVNGVETGTLTSRTGDYDLSSGAFVGRGNAVLVQQTPSGEKKLQTDELHYDVQNGQLWSDKPFVLNEPGGRVTRGASFRTDVAGRSGNASQMRASGLQPPTTQTPGAAGTGTPAPQGTGITF